jgi:hypothetical protein
MNNVTNGETCYVLSVFVAFFLLPPNISAICIQRSNMWILLHTDSPGFTHGRRHTQAKAQNYLKLKTLCFKINGFG